MIVTGRPVRDAGLAEWKRRLERTALHQVTPAAPVYPLPREGRPGALVDIFC